ncbi:MAG: dCTP deaminase [Planctomycetota bacterium]
MAVLCDTQIRELIGIEPFADAEKRASRISYGVSSYGYDVRVGTRFKVFTPTPRSGGIAVVDPKNFNDDFMVEVDLAEEAPDSGGGGFQPPRTSVGEVPVRTQDVPAGRVGERSRRQDASATDTGLVRDHIIIPPNSFALCETVEVFDIPRDVLVICVGKSTYARCGLIVNVTPLEPEWRGKVTLEISNTTPLPAKVYANEGVAQLIFLKGDRVCAVSYADKAGKYQDQDGLTLPKVD